MIQKNLEDNTAQVERSSKRSRYLSAVLFILMLMAGMLAILVSPASSSLAASKDVSGTAMEAGADPAVPLNDAFQFLDPCNLTVTQGQTFTLNLMVNPGGHFVTAQ